MTNEITQQDRDSLRKLFTLFHERAREKGFHEMTDQVHLAASGYRREGEDAYAAYLLSIHRGNRLALIGDEITEARDEIRKGKEPSEVYTSVTDEAKTPKPEGYLTEMADIFVRFGDTIAEEDHYAEHDFIGQFLDVLEDKVSFNSKRSRMNGGKSF